MTGLFYFIKTNEQSPRTKCCIYFYLQSFFDLGVSLLMFRQEVGSQELVLHNW